MTFTRYCAIFLTAEGMGMALDDESVEAIERGWAGKSASGVSLQGDVAWVRFPTESSAVAAARIDTDMSTPGERSELVYRLV